MKKLIILFILAILFIPSIVNAEEYFYDGGYIGTTYIKKIRADGSGQYKRMKSIIRKSDGKLSYCIAPWSNIDDSASYQEVNSIYEISPSTLERIKLISYYGYGYTNHTDDIWYAVTQLLIWREIDPSGKFYFTSTLNGDYTNKYDSYFTEILNLVNNYKFRLDTYNVNLMANKDYRINIQRGNINEFDIVDESHIIKSINNNSINIKAPTSGNFEIYIQRKQIHNGLVQIYASATSQDMLSPGFIDEEQVLKVKALYGEVTINKEDKETGTTPQGDASLIGTKVIINGPSINEIVELNNTLTYTWKNLESGSYSICEYSSGIGYELNHTCFKFEVNENNLKHKYILKNDVIKNVVHIHKSYTDIWNNHLDEEGITFEVFNNNKLYTTCTTSKDGRINLELPYGTYMFHQVNTKEGYTLVDDFEVTINDSTNYIEYELVNKLKEGTLIINKTFGNENISYKEPNVEFEIYSEDKLYTSVKTNKEGIINISIPHGSYKLHQVTSKYGYYKVNDIDFTVDDNNTNIEFNLLDKEKMGLLEIHKLYEINNDFINEENAIFEIYKDNKLITTLNTDNNGYASTNLTYGTYKLHEVIKDNRYIELEDIIFEIGDTNNSIKYDLKDELKKYNLTINKKDLSTNMLINTDDINFLITDFVNNEYRISTINGIASITLPIGDYTIKELNPNTGYILNEDIISITLDKDTNLDFYNTKIEVPDTYSSNYNLLYLLITIYIAIKKIKKYS